MFSLLPVVFHASEIEGRGVFARKRFSPGDPIAPYAPKQTRIAVDHPEAETHAMTKLTLLSGEHVIVPDTSVPGGWLSNHSCEPNAILLATSGRIACVRPIAPGEEVTIFYGWVTINDARRDPCLCGSSRCRGFINFDLTTDDAGNVEIIDGAIATTDDALRTRLEEYGAYLASIGQGHVQKTIATTFARMKR
jgi:SET domain-containing protein